MQPTIPIYFTANVPHEGPRQFVCIMREITFNDGINRFICTSNETPESVWPDAVYKHNAIEGGYDKIGIYTKTETDSYERYNHTTGNWDGAPSIKTYTFIPTPVRFGGTQKFKKSKTMSRWYRIKSKLLKKF
jgi:hypothetical protein